MFECRRSFCLLSMLKCDLSQQMSSKMSNSLNTMVPIGVRFMVLSAFGFALMSATVNMSVFMVSLSLKSLQQEHSVSLVISYLDVKRKRISVWGNNKPLLLARGAVGTFALMCLLFGDHVTFGRSNHLPIHSSGIYGAARCHFLKSEFSPAFICIALCLLGVYVMVRPETGVESAQTLPMFSVMIYFRCFW